MEPSRPCLAVAASKLAAWINLNPVATVLLAVASAVLLVVVLVNGWQESVPAYVVYALSTYALAVLVAGTVRAVRWAGPRVDSLVSGNRALGALAADRDLRGRAGLRASCVLNGAYGVFLLVFGMVYSSPWFGALGVYYLVEAGARGLLTHADGGVRAVVAEVRSGGLGAREGEGARPEEPACEVRPLRAYRACAWLLVVLDLALTGIAVQMVRDGQWFSYPGYVIYVAAGYTFYSATMAVVNLVRSQASDNLVVQAMRALGVCTALVSVHTLQTAMFASFDTSGGALPQVMNAITAAVVCAGIAAVAVGMLLKVRRLEGSAPHGVR